MNVPGLSHTTFQQLASMFERETGIRTSDAKATLFVTRLSPRLRALGLATFDAYAEALARERFPGEFRRFVDLLTTNETYFFREPEQFEHFTRELENPRRPTIVRVWSAACATGEELYSIAMVMHTARGGLSNVELMGSDVSQRVLSQAEQAVYADSRLQNVPPETLRRYFMRGTGKHQGNVRVVPELRERVQFFEHNLMQSPASLGHFDAIWLRNVLIYFAPAQKQRILELACSALRPGGLLYVGLAESLYGHALPLRAVGRSVYERTDVARELDGRAGT